MSKLIKQIVVPANVRKESLMCPNVVNIYEDRVECEGGQGNILFFKDFTAVDIAVASLFCAYAGVRFLNSVNAGALPVNGAAMLSDKNRINFCSGAFSYAPANEFCQKVYSDIKLALTEYKKAPTHEALPNSNMSSLDEIKKLKELLEMGAITQAEYDAKRHSSLVCKLPCPCSPSTGKQGYSSSHHLQILIHSRP